MNLVRTKAVLSKQFHLSPIEVDGMVYWEYELFLQELNRLVEEENEKQKGEMDKADTMRSQYDPKRMQANFKQPKMPNINVNMKSL